MNAMNATRFAVGRSCAAALALVAASCGSDLTSPDPVPVSRTALDATAGTWRTIVLASADQVPVAPPADAASGAYRAEIAEVVAAQRSLNDDQRDRVAYWGAGGVTRWNEVMREMVARFNLPPAPRADGTYPVPDAANPFSDPQFPFANPPYAARAYSYFSVGQYEALKAAWHYKFLYRRAAPSRVDSAVNALIPAGDLPAYPSEDAVLSGVAEVMLRALFPAAAAEIDAKAAEQRAAAIWSGRAAPSDVAAGQALGRAVAALVMARAATDGMRTAGGNAALWQALADGAARRGETAWRSLETPARPPMLPFFGQVRAWMMTPTDIANERPPAPPSTSSAQMQQELAEVRRAVDELTRDQLAIVYRWADGVSTYTPPGHWNEIAAIALRDAGFSEVRTARTFALLNMAMHDAAVGCWEAKFFYFNPRPSQLDPGLKTWTGVPNFPAYTSGHSTFSAAAATVLSYVFPGRAAEFNAFKEEAAISRLYGGIHFRADIEAGKSHGDRIGGYTVRFARQDGAP
jgi:membrane-associated phospholipid phosphatase